MKPGPDSPNWNITPTTVVRIPEALKNNILRITHILDNGGAVSEIDNDTTYWGSEVWDDKELVINMIELLAQSRNRNV